MGALHVTAEHSHLGKWCSETVTADSGKPRIVICVKRSMSKSAAVFPQALKIHCYCEAVIKVPEWIT